MDNNQNIESEKFNSTEYKENLLAGFRVQENLFEAAIQLSISSLRKNVEELEAEFEEITRVMPPEEDFDEDGHRMLRFRTLTGLHNQMSWQREQWLALNEMRVIYLFKNLEISLKSLIQTAYPSTNIKDFDKWESIISFLKQKNINISRVNGYSEANELRRLNNNLKHSLNIGIDVKSIHEFKDAEFFDNSLIEAFLKRIAPRVEDFQISLIEEIRKELYDFDEARLENMAKSYFKRLRKDQAQVFITKIREQYK